MRKVLLIEDDALLCWLLEKILKNQYEVAIMNDGMEAWSWLAQGNVPDLIVSDLKMPGLGGIELLENINGSETHKNIPLIIQDGPRISQIRCPLTSSSETMRPPDPIA